MSSRWGLSAAQMPGMIRLRCVSHRLSRHTMFVTAWDWPNFLLATLIVKPDESSPAIMPSTRAVASLWALVPIDPALLLPSVQPER